MTTPLLSFLLQAEKLKTEMRCSWTSDPARRESVAEHSWMICLIVMSIKERVTLPLDFDRIIKMLVIHDLGEAVIGDVPLRDQVGSYDKKAKAAAEHEAIKKLFSVLPDATRQELLSLWEECEDAITNEAKFAKAIDHLEACLQCYICGLETWEETDYKIAAYYKADLFKIDPFLQKFKDTIDAHTIKMILDAGKENLLPAEILETYEERKSVLSEEL